MNYTIEFEPAGRRGECADNQSLLECARNLGIGLVSVCGGQGKCFGCEIQIVEGKTTEPTDIERNHFTAAELRQGLRLACLTYPLSSCKIHVPAESMTTTQRLQIESLDIKTKIDPPVTIADVTMPEPSSADQRSDTRRLVSNLDDMAIKCSEIDFMVMRSLSNRFREWQWKARAAIKNGEIIALLPQSGKPLGIAVDAGTTKIAAYLVDLATGHTLAVKGAMNPQISYGEDITTRIQYSVKSRDNRLRLQKSLIEAINLVIEELCSETHSDTSQIVDAVFAANTAIHHLALGLPIQGLSYTPFTAAVKEPIDVKAHELGLNIAEGAYVHFPPNIAGFVGSDHTAMLTAINASRIKKATLAIDIGTNTEVSLIYYGRIYSASCASGPAFEGGHIKYGMRATSGAIEKVKVLNGEISFQTINNKEPSGICGSGIIDAVAQCYLDGIIDKGGRIKKDAPHTRIFRDIREIILAKNKKGAPMITLTQKDIREIQLAKGAIRAGIQVLLDEAGLSEENLDKCIIAGAFGSYIDIGNAIEIGLLPTLPQNRFRQVGNAAGSGARMILTSASKRSVTVKITDRIKYVELATVKSFMNLFTESTYLGKYRFIDGKRKEIE